MHYLVHQIFFSSTFGKFQHLLNFDFFKLQNFYRENKDKRREMYTQYIKKLYDLHSSSRNYVEAGLTLQLYVQLLEWKNEQIHSEMGCPPELQCERKEKLLKEIIECFDRGKVNISILKYFPLYSSTKISQCHENVFLIIV